MEAMGEEHKLGEEYQVNIPIQMMAVTDTLGRMNPLRFRLETVDHEIKTVNIKNIVSRSEKTMWEFGKSSTSVSWRWEIPAVQLKFDTVWIRRSGGSISFCRRGNNMVYIFHVDANSAFLSWSTSYRVNILEDRTDLCKVASIVGGDQEKRHGLYLMDLRACMGEDRWWRLPIDSKMKYGRDWGLR